MLTLFGIRRRMALSFSIFLLLVITFTVWGIRAAVEKLTRENITRQQFAMVTMLASSIDDKLGLYLDSLATVATSVTPELIHDPVTGQSFLDERRVLKNFFDNGIYLFDETATILLESPTFKERLSTRPPPEVITFLTNVAKSGMPGTSSPYISPKSGVPSILMAAPLYDRNHRLIGFLAGSLNLVKDFFIEDIMTRKIGKKGYLYLFDTNRTMIVHPDSSRIMKRDVPPGVNRLFDEALKGFEGSGETVNSKGIPQIASFKRLKTVDWILASTYPQDEAYELVRHFFWHYLLPSACIITLLSLLMIWVLSRRITSKLNFFTQQVQQIQQNPDTNREIHIDSKDEVGILADTFNTLLKSISSKEILLHEAEDRLSRALQGSNDGIWDWDQVTGQVFYSPHFIDLLGYTPTDFQPTIDSWAMLIHNQDTDHVWALFRQHFDGESAYLFCEHRLLCKDGSYRWFLARGLAWRDTAGKVVRIAGSLSDISRRKQTEEDLISAREASDAANRSKSAFLAAMSHEIRTPMNGIIGMGELLAGTELNHEQLEYLTSITVSAENLMTIINDILDFSKVESGRIELENIPFGLRSTCSQTVRSLEPRAAAKGVEVILDIASDVPDDLMGDPVKLRQIITNLAGNAIKFTPHGEVLISIRSVQIHEDNVRLACSVRDTGVGIAADQLERIFSPFTQADGSTTRLFGGTGLGLSITRRLVELMGGEVTVTSLPGKGSTFCATLSCGRQSGALDGTTQQSSLNALSIAAARVHAEPLTVRPSGDNLSILVAEDVLINQKLIQRVLEKMGHTVTLAANGEEAVTIWHDAAFDIIFMDIEMPVMDGYSATATIRAIEEKQGGHVPITAMTAHALPGAAEKCLASGMDAYISKPFKTSDVRAVIDRLVPRRSHQPVT
jgi:PAS domain S-box-containing protein